VEARVLILRVRVVFRVAYVLVAGVAFARVAFARVPFERVALRFHMKCLRGLSCVCELRLRVFHLQNYKGGPSEFSNAKYYLNLTRFSPFLGKNRVSLTLLFPHTCQVLQSVRNFPKPQHRLLRLSLLRLKN
jgi:hypothetical protein